jgi:capsular exopolysaccharide synthesis family protein
MSRQINEYALLTDINSKSSLPEAYRALRTNTQYAMADSAAATRKICVTSCIQAEGKTITAANLAITYAQEGKKTLIIDADLRNPVMQRVFGTSNGTGLSQLLLHGSPLQTSIIPTYIENLYLLPAGPIPKNPAELLSSDKMDAMLASAMLEYDTIIIDTPPVLLFTDAQIVAAKSDGVLMVVGAGKVKREAAMKAKGLLEHVQARILGVVLNGKKKTSGDRMYKRFNAAAANS